VGAGRSLAVHRILAVVGSRLGVVRIEVPGHNRRRTGLLLEGEEPVIFRLWYRRKSRSLRA
jgi:hypothetical protein